jgi:hypothetical protein
MARICALEQTQGRVVPCREGDCPFWEPGGAVLSGRCAFDRLDLSGRSDVAAELLRIRTSLESPTSSAEQDLRHLFHHLLNEGGDD